MKYLNAAFIFILFSIASFGGGIAQKLAKAVGEYCRRPDQKLKAKIEQMCGGFTTGLYRKGVQ